MAASRRPPAHRHAAGDEEFSTTRTPRDSKRFACSRALRGRCLEAKTRQEGAFTVRVNRIPVSELGRWPARKQVSVAEVRTANRVLEALVGGWGG
jgi:hypothetical protein